MKTTQKSKPVYLTFPADPQISLLLKDIAHKMGKTQPELISEICIDYVKYYLLDLIEKEANESTTQETQK